MLDFLLAPVIVTSSFDTSNSYLLTRRTVQSQPCIHAYVHARGKLDILLCKWRNQRLAHTLCLNVT